MPTVTVEGEKAFEVPAGTKLVLAVEDAGIDILHRCGGNAKCTTCRVEVLAFRDSASQELLDQADRFLHLPEHAVLLAERSRP